MKTKKSSIFGRIFIIILTVFLSELFLFTFSLSFATEKLVKEVTEIRLDDYLKSANLLDSGDGGNLEFDSAAGDYIECIIINLDPDNIGEYSYTKTDKVDELLTKAEIENLVKEAYYAIPNITHGDIKHNNQNIYYAYALTRYSNTVAIGICSDDYLNSSIFDLIVIFLGQSTKSGEKFDIGL